MKFDPNSLFQSARSIRLRPEEFHAIRGQLKMSVIKTENDRHSVTMDQQNFLESAAHISLRADEKAVIREAIMTDMETTDLLNPRRFHGWMRLFSGSMAAVVLFIICGAGASYAAESALPGDALYTVKVNFTEAILLRLNSSLEAKARVRARLTSRRLEETEKLAAASLLNTERIAIVEQRLAVNVAALEVDLRELATLNKKVSADIAIDTAAEIEAHESLLLRIIQEKDRQAVQKLVDTAAKARRLVENTASVVNQLDRINMVGSKAEREIMKAKSIIRTQQNTDIADAILHAEAELSASMEKGLSQDLKMKKSTSALKKAKEANALLRLPKHVKLATPPQPSTTVEVEQETMSSLSSRNSSSTTSSASSQSSSQAAASESSSAQTQSSTSTSASVSSSAADILKKTDDIIKKSLPRL